AAGAVDVAVTTPGGSATLAGAFTFEVPASSDATLASLAVSSGTLDPAFAPATTSYALDLPNTTGSITVTPTASDAGATIVLNGTPLASGTASAPIALAVGNTTITLVVTAEDGTTTQSYTILVTRAAAAPTLTAVAPATGPVAGGTSVTLTGTDLTGATAVTFGGTPAASFTVDSATQITAVTPAHAAGAVDVAVTTPGGSATLAGAFTFEVPASSDATLASLAVSTGTLDPAFAPATTSYALDLPNTTGSITVTPTASDAGATIVLNGTPLASGTASAPIALAVGNTTITLVFTAEDGTTTQSYTILVTRAAAAPTLTAVAPATGPVAGGTSVTLTGTDLTDATAVTFGGTPAASFTVDSATQITAVTPAHAAGAVDVAVTTPGGSATLAGAFTFEVPASSDATLASLAVSSGTLDPAFAPATTSYALDLPNTTGSITVTPTASDAGATIVLNGTPLASGTASA